MKHITLLSPLTPLQIGTCIHWLFCMKFNAQQLLLEQFFDIIGNFGSTHPKSETTFPFQYNKYLKHIDLSSFLVPPSVEIDTCIHWVFCKKFNSKQLLFKQCFDIIGNFGSLQAKSESTFPIQYNLIFETY